MKLKDLDPKTYANLRRVAWFLGRTPSELVAEGQVEYAPPEVLIRFPHPFFPKLRLVAAATPKLALVRVDFSEGHQKEGTRILYERWS